MCTTSVLDHQASQRGLEGGWGGGFWYEGSTWNAAQREASPPPPRLGQVMDKKNLLDSQTPASPNPFQEPRLCRKTKGARSHLSHPHVRSLPLELRHGTTVASRERKRPARPEVGASLLRRKRRLGAGVATNLAPVRLCSAHLCLSLFLRCPLGRRLSPSPF